MQQPDFPLERLEADLRQALDAAAEPVQGHGVRQEAIRQAVERRRRARRTLRFSLVTAAVAAAVALVFLLPPGEKRVRMAENPPATASTPPSAPGVSGDTTPLPGGESAPGTLPPAPPTTHPAPGAIPPLPLGDLPPELTDPLPGDRTWALYLAVAPPGDNDAPELGAADQARADAGYRSGAYGTLACDDGAAEALGREPSSLTVAVRFATEAEADRARTAFQQRGHEVVGVVEVVVAGCAAPNPPPTSPPTNPPAAAP